jgi:PAS domain S-box-containing protein
MTGADSPAAREEVAAPLPSRAGALLSGLAAAFALPVATLVLVQPFARWVHAVPFVFFVPAVIAVGWLAGEWPGVLGALLSGVLANRFALSAGPRFDTSVAGLVSTAFFCALGALLAVGASRLRVRAAEAQALAREVAKRLELERAARAAERSESDERERIAEVLRKSEERFRSLVEALPQLVFTASREGKLELHNRQVLEYGGLSEEELSGVGWTRLLHPEDLSIAAEARRQAISSGQPVSFDLRLRRRDGLYRWFLVSMVPLRGAGGELREWFGICTDIHAQKEAIQAQAEAVHARDVFLSVASHELKTPLTAAQLQIQSAQRQLRREPGETAAHLALRLEATGKSVERLSALVNALLDVSQVAAGKIVTQCEPFDLSELVARTVERLAEAARGRGCELGLEVEGGVSMVGDPLRIEQVLTNLLSNAIKYGEGRPVTVRLRRPNARHVALDVVDHGIGIARDDQVRIFEKFERAASARHYGGLGLGLWIARQIVEASGGALRVSSEAGEGSTFTVELPLDRDAQAPVALG